MSSNDDIITMESSKQLKALEDDVKIRNTVYLSEFRKYIGIYNKDYVAKLTPKENLALGVEFAQRFSRRHPIIVVNESDETDTFELPALFCSTSLLNESQEAVATDVVSRLETASSVKDKLVDRITPIANELLNMYRAIGGNPKVVEENKAYHDCIDMLTKKINGGVNQTTPSPKILIEPSMKDLL